jgi:putative lipoprotein
MKPYALPLLLLPLTALATGETQSYRCTDGSQIKIAFSVSLEGRPQADLRLAGRRLNLPQVPASNGILYRAGEIRLHTKDNQVVFEDGKGKVRRCQQGDTPPVTKATVAATSSFLDISGRIFYFSRTALPADAVLIIQIEDSAHRRARPLAEQQIDLAGQTAPVAFQTTIDRDLIGKKARITVRARIEQNGKPLFASKESHPALNKGQPIPVDMQLQQVSDAM